MKACILRSYLGTERHLLLDTADKTSGSWTRAVPDDAWALGVAPTNHHLDLRVLSEYAGCSIDWDVPRKYTRADEEANVDVSRFIRTVPRDALLAHVCQLLSSAESLSDASRDQYITGMFADTRRQLADLQRARVDPTAWNEATHETDSPALQSLEPDSDGLVDQVVYDQLGTITGRMTVASGPHILTLRRDLRRVLRPTKRGQRLLMIDFVSHEPRVALCLKGETPPLDIYGWFKEEHLPSASRDDAKGAIISTLYGMTPGTLSDKLGVTLTEAKILNEIVRVTFGLDKLEKDLTRSHSQRGEISSAFGRRIKPSSSSPGVLVNSYIQGTSYDIAMAGFRRILSMCATALIETHVFFYIHDAMILEIPERDEDRLRTLLGVPINIPDCPGQYWAKVKEVTE